MSSQYFSLSSDKHIAGQKLMVGFSGTKLDEELKFIIDSLHVGGIILFACNIKSPNQLKELCRSAKEYAISCGLPPLFIAVDQEGGEVARLKPPFFTAFSGNPSMKNVEEAVNFAQITSKELHDVGINMNMAPVMDINAKGIDSIMVRRAFGQDPNWVSKLGTTVINTFQQNKIMAVAKHFPGIGRTTLDSHLHLPILETDFSKLKQIDLPPFNAAILHNVAGMMLSHILYTDIDKQWPASLSPKIARNLLRDKMKYNGVVMTDDIDMKAIKWDIKIVIQQIVASDIDIALICHKGPNIQKAFDFMVHEVGKSDKSRVDSIKSVKRIIELKKQYL